MSDLPHATSFKPQQPHKRRISISRFKDFPAPALALIETLLSIDPAARLSAAHALNSEYFSSKPLACEPAELPKYPSSRELDARVRAEEARRQGEAGSKGKRCDDEGEGTAESRAIPEPNANVEQGDNRHTQIIRRYANEDGNNSSRDQLLLGYYSKGKNIQHSGPLLAPPDNVYQMRRDNERRHVQETSRHAHVDKAKQKRVQGEAIPLPTNAIYVGPSTE